MDQKLVFGKVALITGAAKGIGEATALAFAREGAKVMLSDMDPAGEMVAGYIRKSGGDAAFMRCDVSRASDVEALVAETVRAFGQLDVAFNNAGISGVQAPLADISLEAWQKTIDVNLTGVFLCMKAELAAMLAQGGGAIINNASILGTVGFAGASAYVAAKHAVVGLTKVAAIEYAERKIRVNSVCPGFIETPMLKGAGLLDTPGVRQMLEGLHPIKRLGRPEEIAEVVVFLGSDRASFVTGDAVLVDGGYVSQ